MNISPVAEESTAATSTSTFDATTARKQWQVILRRFVRHRAAVAGMVLFILLILLAFVGPSVWTITFSDTSFDGYLPPSADHPLGTGQIGQDTLAQVLRGMQFSLKIAIIVAVLATFIGVILGSLAGYLRGWVDSTISRLIDLILVLPGLVIVAVIARSSFQITSSGATGSNWLIVAIYLGLVGWLSIARIIRAMVLSLREKEFVEAARALGGSTARIVFKHILPNTVDVIIVNATLAIAQAVLIEAALSFVGLGVQAPDTSLGKLISDNQTELPVHPWLFLAPFLFIVLISLSINFMGDGLRDAFDPRQKRVRA